MEGEGKGRELFSKKGVRRVKEKGGEEEDVRMTRK
jgi:hypothetical protein